MKRILTWLVTNPVATNLLVGFVVLAGIAAFARIAVRTYPDIDVPIVSITVAYLGAAPEEVERGVCTRIEDHVDGIVGVREVHSTADEGICTVQVELLQDADRNETLNDIRDRINAIETFPAEVEKPLVRLLKLPSPVIDIAVTGPTDERTLKQLARRVRADILALPGITQAVVANVRDYEIAVEVSEASLLRNGLTFDEVAAAVSGNSVDLPGGTINAEQGQVLLRTEGQAYRAAELKKIMVKARPDGSRILLEDIAEVIDGFEDTTTRFVFDGAPAALVKVSRVGDQDMRQIAAAVKGYVEASEAEYADRDARLVVWNDRSTMLRDRLGALVDSGLQGLLIVLIILALFLRPSTALWVSVGIPIAFLGAMFLLFVFGISINLMTITGFILVLGMLVDDAVVVGESAYVAQRGGAAQLAGVIDGTQRVLVPVAFGVLTTVAAFMPMLYMTGNAGTLLANVGAVVICCLAFSLIECVFVLPAHLGHRSDSLPFGEFGMVLLSILVLAALAYAPSLRAGIALGIAAVGIVWAAQIWGLLNRLGSAFTRVQVRFEEAFDAFTKGSFRRAVRAALRRPALAITTGLAVLLLAFAVVASGRLPFSLITPVHEDRIAAKLTMPFGINEAVTAEVMARLRDGAMEVASRFEEEHGLPVVLHVGESYGSHGRSEETVGQPVVPGASHLGEVIMQLTPAEERPVATPEIAAAWRDAVGRVDEAVKLVFDSEIQSQGTGIELRLTGDDMDDLRALAALLVAEAGEYPGVVEVGDTFLAGKNELTLSLTPTGQALGLTLSDLGRQVRQAFYGEEAQRVQRGEDDVRIMVRYPEQARRSLASLESLRIRTADGGEVPFRTVAAVEWGRGASTITRIAGTRAISVNAKLDLDRTSADQVRAALQGFLAETMAAYPDISYSFESARKTREELARTGPFFLIALFAIFALLAIPLRSYGQPLIILSVLPFCLVGAVMGHLLMVLIPGAVVGLSLASVMGMIAAIGVGVNATLVLLHSVNQFRAAGDSPIDALENAAVERCRPILITSATTVAGLTPLMLNTSASIASMRPIVISLAFGVALAAVAALLFVPALWLALDRILERAKRVTTGLGDLVGGAARLAKWVARYPYVQEGLSRQEFTDLVVDEEAFDAETARIARVGLVRLYYQREFDSQTMAAELAEKSKRTPTADDLVAEVRSWAQQRAFQLAAHMLRGAISPVEAARPLSNILDTSLAKLLDAARLKTAKEYGELPGSNVALVALNAAGRREHVAGGPLQILFVYDCQDLPMSLTVTPEVWHARSARRFMRFMRNLSPAKMLFAAEPPYRLAGLGQDADAYAMADVESLVDATPSLADIRMLVHARVVCADGDLEERFEAIRRRAVSRPREKEAVARELSVLRARRRRRMWNVGDQPGGLGDLALAAEYLQLTGAVDAPEVMVSGLVPTFEAAAEHGLLETAAGRELAEAAALWHNLSGFLSLVSADESDPGKASPEHRRTLAEVCGAATYEDLERLVATTARRTVGHLDALF